MDGPWLEAVVGTVNPRLAALPPDVVMRSLLFQLRAFVNAGFLHDHREVVASVRLSTRAA